MKHKNQSFKVLMEKNRLNTNYIFLGVGLSLFLLNIATFITFIKSGDYSKIWFNLSVLSSMIVILIATYNIHN